MYPQWRSFRRKLKDDGKMYYVEDETNLFEKEKV